MDAILIQKFKDAISRSQNIGIIAPSNPSVDQMAAALSLYLVLTSVNKRVNIASATDPIVEISSLVGITKVQKTLSGDSGDLVVSFPYLEGEIEKVSYTIENNFLNIIVKASESGLSFDDRDVRYTRGSGAIDLLFAIGLSNLQEAGTVLDLNTLKNTKVVNIDNNSTNQGYGDIVFVDTNASSVSEQIADLVLTLGFNIDADIAQNLMSGISGATQNFQSPNTTSLAFEMMGILLRKGAQRPMTRPLPQQPAIRDEAQVKADLSGFMQQQPAPLQPAPQQPMIPSMQHGQNEPRRPLGQPPQPQTQMQQQQTQPMQNEQADVQDSNNKPPLDWLAPKVYKGSSNFEG